MVTRTTFAVHLRKLVAWKKSQSLPKAKREYLPKFL